MLEPLERVFQIPPYLLNIVRVYLRDRHLKYDTADGPKTKEISGETAKVSVMGPDIWNVDYDGCCVWTCPLTTTSWVIPTT